MLFRLFSDTKDVIYDGVLNIFRCNPDSCDGFYTDDENCIIPVIQDNTGIINVFYGYPFKFLCFEKFTFNTFAEIDDGEIVTYNTIDDIEDCENIIFAYVSMENIDQLSNFPNLKFLFLHSLIKDESKLNEIYKKYPSIEKIEFNHYNFDMVECRNIDFTKFWMPYFPCMRQYANFKFNDEYPRPIILMRRENFREITVTWRGHKYIYTGPSEDMKIIKI